MDDRDAAGIFSKEFCGIESGIIRPADIDLVLEVDALVVCKYVVISHGAVWQLGELEVVVVVEELESGLAYLDPDLADLCNRLGDRDLRKAVAAPESTALPAALAASI